MFQVKTDRREQQGERNGERDDDGAAHVTQEEHQDDDDQNDAFGEVVQHGVGGEMDEVAAVEEGNNLDALGQNVAVQLLHLGLERFERRIGVRSLLQQDCALDYVRVVN